MLYTQHDVGPSVHHIWHGLIQLSQLYVAFHTHKARHFAFHSCLYLLQAKGQHYMQIGVDAHETEGVASGMQVATKGRDRERRVRRTPRRTRRVATNQCFCLLSGCLCQAQVRGHCRRKKKAKQTTANTSFANEYVGAHQFPASPRNPAQKRV